MTISTTASRISYNGNGVTTVFSFPYRFLANGDLVVVEVSSTGVETVKTLTTHYTLTGAGDDAGGSVTMLVAPASGTRLIVYRDTDIVQETDYVSGDPFPAESHEQALDRLTMICQEIAGDTGEAIKVPVGDPSNLTTTLPAAVDRLDKFIVFDATTGATELSTVTQTQVASAVAAAYAAGSTADAVTYLPASGPSLSVQAHLRDIDAELDLVVHKTADTGAAIMPAGTTAQRPTPAAGHMRLNTTTGGFEGYDGSNWTEFGGVNNYINIRDYESLVSGGSWTAAFNQAVLDAIASNTRTIYFPYDITDNNGNYEFDTAPAVMGSGILLRGESPRQFLVRNYTPTGTDGTQARAFLVWDGSDYASDPNQNKGGGMVNLGIGAGNGTTTGTAIYITGADTNNRPGYMVFQNVVVSVPNGSTGTWSFGLQVKGAGVTTAGSQGMRDLTFIAMYVFRCTGDPVQITNGVHIHVHGLTVSDGGAGNANPYVRINGGGSGTSNSIQCVLNNLDIEGTVAFTDCSYIVAMGYSNRIESAATATNCKFIGIVNTNAAPHITFV